MAEIEDQIIKPLTDVLKNWSNTLVDATEAGMGELYVFWTDKHQNASDLLLTCHSTTEASMGDQIRSHLRGVPCAIERNQKKNASIRGKKKKPLHATETASKVKRKKANSP